MIMTIPTHPSWLNVLRLGLLVSAAGWGISFGFVFQSWDACTIWLYSMGAQPIHYQPLLDYWLKMAAATFGGIGIASLLACFWPQEFRGMIRLLGPFHLLLAMVLLVSARQNHLERLSATPLRPDVVFCLLAGVLILFPLVMAGRKLSPAR